MLVKKEKYMIPTKKLKTNLKELKDNLSKIYKHISLNKCEEKRVKYHDFKDGIKTKQKKGVKSDIVFIYAPKNKEDNFTNFSFEFDYKDKLESEQLITVCLKPLHLKAKKEETDLEKIVRLRMNKKIISKTFKIEEMKKLINEFNKELVKETELTEQKVLGILNKIFFLGRIDINKKYNEALEYKNSMLLKH